MAINRQAVAPTKFITEEWSPDKGNKFEWILQQVEKQRNLGIKLQVVNSKPRPIRGK